MVVVALPPRLSPPSLGQDSSLRYRSNLYYTMKEGFFVQQSVYDSPLGPVFLWFKEGRLIYATFREDYGNEWLAKRFPQSKAEMQPLQKGFQADLDTYFSGARMEFAWPLQLTGTDFQKRVWQEIQAIPHGQVTTYKKIGESLGTKAFRAIGQACGANPISLIIPCHRVLGTHSLGGYGGGTNRKRLLLELENVTLAPNLWA
jgi:methylated-DNA-[protein]-cysteine S-methyltransferase